MSNPARVLVGLVTAAILLTGAAADAVIIRHDRSEADALSLGARFTAVGRVLRGGGATLVAPGWAVTAAHVAAPLQPEDRLQFADKTYAMKRVVLYPGVRVRRACRVVGHRGVSRRDDCRHRRPRPAG